MKKLILLYLLVIAMQGFGQSPGNITRVEYFFDSDPGYGNGVPVTFTPAKLIDLNFSADIKSLSNGFHFIFIRTKDANKLWSNVFNRCFLKDKLETEKLNNISYLEYFIDTDPGYGKGTKIAITASTLEDKSFTADLSKITDGFHTISVRMKDVNNLWSTVFNRTFIKENIVTDPLNKISYAEYFVDTDPGFGKATPLTLTTGEKKAILVKEFIATLPDISLGNHRFYMRSKDEKENWSLTYDTVYCQGPSAKFSANTVCFGNNTSFTYLSPNKDANSLFYWDVNNDGKIESNTKGSITYKYPAAGTYNAKLLITNSSVCPEAVRDSFYSSVTVNPLPVASVTPTGQISVCADTAAVLTAQDASGYSFLWYYNNILISGATSSSYHAKQSGSYKVVVTNSFTCSSTSNVVTVIVNPLPAAVITPSGPTAFCYGYSVVLNANSGSGLTYQWELQSANIPGATYSSFTANLSGMYNLLVTNSNNCRKLSDPVFVTVYPLPAPELGKDTSIFINKQIVLDAGSGYSQYHWNDNSTNETLTVIGSQLGVGKFNFSVTVTDNNGCMGSDTVAVTVKPLYTISGFVRYENKIQTILDSVKLYLLNSKGDKIDSTYSGINGAYLFSNVETGTYSLKGKTKKPWRGGNPVDALMINRFYLKLFLFATPLKQRGADLNADNKINPVDALLVNRRYIKVVNSFKSGDWLFDNSSIIVTNTNVTFNLNGLCYGDVNGSY